MDQPAWYWGSWLLVHSIDIDDIKPPTDSCEKIEILQFLEIIWFASFFDVGRGCTLRHHQFRTHTKTSSGHATQKNNLYLFAIILPFNADLAASAGVVVVVVAVVSATVVVDDNLVEFSFLLFPLPPPLFPLPLELVLEPLE